MERDREPLEYATPGREPSAPMGPLVRRLGVFLLIGGIVWALSGTAGVDDETQIFAGCALGGLGLVVAILGQILHAVETRR